jgi:hypothetical protein
MSIHLQRIRLFATTKDQADAGTDSGVTLWYYINLHVMTTFPTKGWNSQELARPWKDRERGRTDVYEVDFRTGEHELIVSGTTVPRGIAFSDFVHARTGSFWLRMMGEDWWKLDHYYLLGSFQELRHVLGTIDVFETIDHGWLLMARRDGDVEWSTDPLEGATWHHIELNGTLI